MTNKWIPTDRDDRASDSHALREAMCEIMSKYNDSSPVHYDEVADEILECIDIWLEAIYGPPKSKARNKL